MDYCIHDNNTKACFYCKINQKKEKEKFLEKNKNNEVLSFTQYFDQDIEQIKCQLEIQEIFKTSQYALGTIPRV